VPNIIVFFWFGWASQVIVPLKHIHKQLMCVPGARLYECARARMYFLDTFVCIAANRL
jgi:hypothetical protein